MKLIKKRNYQPAFPTFFDDFFTKDFLGLERDTSWVKSNPAVNIKEVDDAFLIEVAAPGLTKEDFKLEMDKNILTISFENKEEKEETGKYTRKEFSYTSFKRSFTIPTETVDVERIDAKYDNGILNLHLPKKEEMKEKAKRTIEVG